MTQTLTSLDETVLPYLTKEGLVSSDRYLPTLDLFRDSIFWNSWALKALFALAIGHILAGIIFFFAHNWFDLSDLTKFAVVGGGIAISVLGWMALKLDSVVAQALGITATVLVGVMFAVFGQVYQTPALIHTPFVLWAFMTLPFVAMSRNLAHWAVWLVIAVVAVFAFASTGIRITGNDFGADAFVIGAGSVFIIALVLYDRYLAGKTVWTQAEWFRVLVIAVIGMFLIVGFTTSFWDWRNGEHLSLSILAVLIGVLLLGYLYRFKPTLAGLAVATFALFCMALQFLFRIFDNIGDTASLLLIFIGIVAMIIGMAKAFTHFAKISSVGNETNPQAQQETNTTPLFVSTTDLATTLGQDETDIESALAKNTEAHSPWYIETFLAIGGVFAAIFGCGFVGSFLGLIISQFDDFGTPLLLIGLAVFGGAVALRMKTGNGFTRHFFNTLILVGSITAIIGLGIVVEHFEVPLLFAILLSVLTLVLVRDRIIEFMSALTLIGCLGFEFYYRLEWMLPETLFLILSTALGIFLLTRPLGKRLYGAAATAFLIAPALLGILLVHFDRFERLIGEDFIEPLNIIPRLCSLAVIAVAVIWLNVANQNQQGWRPPLFILVPLVLAMALLPFGGASALLLILTGYILGSRSLAIIGVLLQIYFLYMFYYDLALSLGVKSYLLLATGVIFLGVWYAADKFAKREIVS